MELTRKAIDIIEGALQKDISLFISVHTLKELLQYPNISTEEENRIMQDLPKICGLITTTRQIAEVAGYLSRQSTEYRHHHVEDCYIAATAIVKDMPLVTRNSKDFQYVKHESLRIVDIESNTFFVGVRVGQDQD